MDGDVGAAELSTGKTELELTRPPVNFELDWTTNGNTVDDRRPAAVSLKITLREIVGIECKTSEDITGSNLELEIFNKDEELEMAW